jgi:nicotinamide-nucleotide amidase
MTSAPPTIEIIAVGTELLTPHYQDTNSLFITQRLNDLGLSVRFKSIVGDGAEDLESCVQTALKRSDWIFTTGGLGPTEDDRTREAVAAALGRELIFCPDILHGIESLFNKMGVPMSSSNRKQAYIIQDAEILANKNGTAPGLWVTEKEQRIILLPGPPRELEPMFAASVWPRIQTERSFYQAHKVLKMVGTGESSVESLISDLHPHDPRLNLTMLSSPGQIEIHLTARSDHNENEAKELVEELAENLQMRLQPYLFSTAGEELEEVVGRSLLQKHMSLAVAESCTGGLLGHRITQVPGSSRYFLGGVQAYSNQLKIELLRVPEQQIIQYGAVSAEVAQSMAAGIRNLAHANYGLGITGIAGPDGGTPEKPVGLVYIALESDHGSVCERSVFPGNRDGIKRRASQKALDILRKQLSSSSREDAERLDG